MEKDFGVAPWEKKSADTQYSTQTPSRKAAAWKTPTLVIHGAKDYRLFESEGLATFKASQRQGIPSQFLYFENENHWVLNSKIQLFGTRALSHGSGSGHQPGLPHLRVGFVALPTLAFCLVAFRAGRWRDPNAESQHIRHGARNEVDKKHLGPGTCYRGGSAHVYAAGIARYQPFKSNFKLWLFHGFLCRLSSYRLFFGSKFTAQQQREQPRGES